MQVLTRLSLAATITTAFLLNAVSVYADPKAAPRPSASPFVLKEKDASPKLQPINVDLEVARVKRQMRAIQAMPIPRDQKIQKQQELLDNEIVHANEQMREKQTSDSKESTEAARDRRKSGMDAIQKFIDIIHSMNPQI
jgi:hypothetical protein